MDLGLGKNITIKGRGKGRRLDLPGGHMTTSLRTLPHSMQSVLLLCEKYIILS